MVLKKRNVLTLLTCWLCQNYCICTIIPQVFICSISRPGLWSFK